MKSLEQCEATAKNKAQQLLARARRETGVNSPDENNELMQVCGYVWEKLGGGEGGGVCVHVCVHGYAVSLSLM